MACWRGCCGGGGGVLAHGGSSRRFPKQIRRSPLRLFSVFLFSKFPPGFKLPLFSCFFLFFLVFVGSLSSGGCFSLFLSLFGFFLSFLRVALLFCFFFFFGFFSIYRGKVRGPFSSGERFRGWLNHPRQPGVVFFSLSTGGRPTTSVGGPPVWGLGLFGGDIGEREAGRFSKKKQSFFTLLQVRGRGRRNGNNAVQNGTVRSLFFKKKKKMKRRRCG